MPTVPAISGRRVAPQGIPNARIEGGTVPGADLARGLQTVSAVASQIAQEERDKADNAALLEAENQLDAWESGALFDAQNGAFTRRGKDAFDLPNQVLPNFDAESKRIEEGIGSERAKLAFQQRRQQRRAFIERKLNEHEAGERNQYYDAQDEATLRSSRGVAANFYNAPERIAQELSKQEAVIEAHGTRKGLSREQIDEAKRAARSGTHTDVVERYLARGEWRRGQIYFEEVRDQIGADEATRLESAFTVERRRAEAEAKAAQAELRQALAERVRDATAAYRLGLGFDAPPSRAEFVAALGAENGNKAFESFQKEQQLGADMAQLALMSDQERASLLQSRFPQGTAGAAEAAERYRVLASQADRLLQQRETDPAAYAARYSPRVASAWTAAQESPEAARAYATATLAEQQRLGVRQPKILPEAAAAALAQSFHTQPGEDVAALIATEQQKWGPHWPKVFGELAAKKIPPAALAIGRGMDPGAAVRLAGVAALPMEELQKGVATPPADIREEIVPRMAEFQRSLDGVIGAENTFAGMYDAVQRLTYSYLRQGRSLGDAAEQAYNEVIGQHYAFREVNGRTFRVPIEYDSPSIERGAQRALASVPMDALQPIIATATGTTESAAADYKRAIARRGYWVTSANGESGLALFLDGAPVLRKDGSVYEVSWDSLLADIQAERGERARRETEALIREVEGRR